MKCHICGETQINMTNVYDHKGEKVLHQLCPACVKNIDKENTSKFGIWEWTEEALCPSCRGKLRRQGESDTSIVEAGRALDYVISYFDPVTMVKRFATGMGKFILSEIKGEQASILRQCSQCDAYATKCPNCWKIFIPGQEPEFMDGVSTQCPKCAQKIKAFD